MEVVNAEEILVPARKTLVVNHDSRQQGLTLFLEKVAFAEEETRFYLVVRNQTAYKCHIHASTAMVFLDGQEYRLRGFLVTRGRLARATLSLAPARLPPATAAGRVSTRGSPNRRDRAP